MFNSMKKRNAIIITVAIASMLMLGGCGGKKSEDTAGNEASTTVATTTTTTDAATTADATTTGTEAATTAETTAATEATGTTEQTAASAEKTAPEKSSEDKKASESNVKAKEGKEIKNKKNEYSLVLPKGWEKDEEDEAMGLHIESPTKDEKTGTALGGVLVNIEEVDKTVKNLEDYKKFLTKEMNEDKSPAFSIQEKEISGLKGLLVKNEIGWGTDQKIVQYVFSTLKGNKAYTIMYMGDTKTYEKEKNDVEAIFSSFKILK